MFNLFITQKVESVRPSRYGLVLHRPECRELVFAPIPLHLAFRWAYTLWLWLVWGVKLPLGGRF